MPEKKYVKPSHATLDKIITESENKNTNGEHYKVIMSLSTLSQQDASYIISKLGEKNEYGRDVNRLNNPNVRNKNVAITKDPTKYMELMDDTPGITAYRQQLRHSFTVAIKEKDGGIAAIDYLTLKYDEKDKEFIKAVEDKKDDLKEFFTFLSSIEGRPRGVK